MSNPKPFVVFDEDLEQLAAFAYPDHAASFIAVVGAGSTVRFTPRGGAPRVVWTEGAEEFPASESYDQAARLMMDRIEKSRR